MFMKDDIDKHTFFKIKRFLNKHMIKKGKDLAIEYFVCWTRYDPEWDKWYNVKDLDNATNLIYSYKEVFS